MGDWRKEQNAWVERAYGSKGIRTSTGSPDNRRSYSQFESEQRAASLSRSNPLAASFPSSPTDTSSYNYRVEAGGGGIFLLVLTGIVLFTSAVEYVQQNIGGSAESAAVIVIAGIVIAVLILRMFWTLFLLFIELVFNGIGAIWGTRIGKIVISAGMIAGGLYGANRAYGDKGAEFFTATLITGFGAWAIFLALKWFFSTSVVKLTTRAVLIGGFVVLAWYVYTVMPR